MNQARPIGIQDVKFKAQTIESSLRKSHYNDSVEEIANKGFDRSNGLLNAIQYLEKSYL